MAIYMKFPGATGNVTAKGHEGWIGLETFDMETNRSIHTTPGRINDRDATRPHFSEISIIKRIDSASPAFFHAVTVGKAVNDVEIHVCATSNELSPILKYKLSNVIVSHRGIQILKHIGPMVKLRLNFTAIEETVIPWDSSNQEKSPMTSGYDLEKAQAL